MSHNRETTTQDQQTPTTSKEEKASESIFGEAFYFEDVMLSITKLDDKDESETSIEPKLYVESLGTRVRKALDSCKGFTSLVEMAESFEDDSKVNIRLNVSQTTHPEFDALISNIDAKDTKMVETRLGTFAVPVPKSEMLPTYQRVFSKVAAASVQTLKDTHNLLSNKSIDVKQLLETITEESARAIDALTKTPARKEVMTHILSILMLERMKERQLHLICDEYSKPEMWVDPLTQGLWVTNHSDDHPSFSASRVRKVRAEFCLDDNQVQQLKAIAFSRNARECAAAKLNLYSRLKPHVAQQVKQRPKQVLAIAMAEAELTQGEVLAVMFSNIRDTDQTRCPECGTGIQLGGVMYHQKCSVIEWLQEHFFFKYDEKLGILSQQVVAYLDQNQRAMLEAIMTHHKTLSAPFKIKKGASYSKMQFTQEGARTLTDIRTNPNFVPGTDEWLERKRREDEARRRANQMRF